MTTIQLPDDVGKMATQTAKSAGYANVDDYVADLICQSEPISPELEAELLKGIGLPGRVITPAEWEAKRQALREKVHTGKQ